MNLRRFDRFSDGHFGEDRRKSLGKHTFTRSGRTDEKHVMPACGGNFKRTLGAKLSLYVGKIQPRIGFFRFKNGFIKDGRGERNFSFQMCQKLLHGRNGIDADTLHDCRFRRIFRGDKKLLHAVFLCRHAHGERTAYTAKLTRKRKLPNEAFVIERHMLGNRARAFHDGDEDGKVIG